MWILNLNARGRATSAIFSTVTAAMKTGFIFDAPQPE